MKAIKCSCGKKANYSNKLRFNGENIDGWVCEFCKEKFYNPKRAQQILQLNKLKKQKYELTLTQVKSNLILRIPKEISDALSLHKGGKVEFSLKSPKEIVIHPIV